MSMSLGRYIEAPAKAAPTSKARKPKRPAANRVVSDLRRRLAAAAIELSAAAEERRQICKARDAAVVRLAAAHRCIEENDGLKADAFKHIADAVHVRRHMELQVRQINVLLGMIRSSRSKALKAKLEKFDWHQPEAMKLG